MPLITSVVSLVGTSHTPLATGGLSPAFLLSSSAGNQLTGDSVNGGLVLAPKVVGALSAGTGSIPAINPSADSGSISCVASTTAVQQLNSTWTVGGTATAVALATTNAVTKLRRIRYVTAATANTTAGAIQNNGANLANTAGTTGHFCAIVSAASATNITTECGFFGFQNGAVFATGFTPVTKTNCFGIGYDPASPNLRLYVAGTATATPIDLGANFPRGFNSSDAYKITLYLCSAEETLATGQIARWHVAKVGSPTLATSGVISSTSVFAANTLFLSPTVVVSPMATAAAASISFTNVKFAIGIN